MDAAVIEFDVVVVGAGMTGATLALALGQAGLRTAIVDAAAIETRVDAAFDGRASAVAYANLRQWRALGVADKLAPHAQPITRIVVADGPGPGASAAGGLPAFLQFGADDIAALPMKDAEAGDIKEPLGWMVENRHLRAGLNTALAPTGVETFAPAELAAIEVGCRLACVTLKDGRRLGAPVVVGADGRASRVRHAAGLTINGWDYRQAGVVATVGLETPHQGVAHQYFLPGGPLAILPLTGDRASLVWTEAPAAAQALAEASPPAFEAHLARRFGERLGRPRLLGPRFTYPLRLQLAAALTAPRTALIGDAAHVIHPIAGQGLNMGLKDAAALAEVLVEAHRLGEDLGSIAVLERYARWRRFDSAALALATDLFNRLFSTDQPLARAVRGAGLAMVERLPAAKRLFVREAGASLGDLPRLLRGQAP